MWRSVVCLIAREKHGSVIVGDPPIGLGVVDDEGWTGGVHGRLPGSSGCLTEGPRLVVLVLFHQAFRLKLREKGPGNMPLVAFMPSVNAQSSSDLRVLQSFRACLEEQ